MKSRISRALAPALLLSALLAGCENPFDDDSFHNGELAKARTLWTSKNVGSYSYILQLQCVCDAAGTVRVRVTNGATSGVFYMNSSGGDAAPAPAGLYDDYDSVEDLFAFIQDAIARDATVLQVSYEDNYGFPDLVNVDYSGRQNNDQVLVIIQQFAVTT